MHTHGLLFISNLFCSQTTQVICPRQWRDVLLKVEEVPLTKSIMDFVGRKSTLQNEILGDLQLKFTSALKGEGLPLEELGSALGVGHSRTLRGTGFIKMCFSCTMTSFMGASLLLTTAQEAVSYITSHICSHAASVCVAQPVHPSESRPSMSL
ncbi:hypothetical protein PAXRUDRAFT_831692, partial [Paxillus rubicundulus Ve08.2h10]